MTAKETTELDVQIVSVKLDAPLTNQAGKAYTGCEVVYKTEGGKLYNKCMASTTFNYNKTLRTQLEEFVSGGYAHIVVEKNGNFTNWVSVTKAEPVSVAEAAPSKAATPTADVPTKTQVRSSYETPEERAARQVMIVRQSSLTAALKLAELVQSQGNEFLPTEGDIIESAKVFEAYVLDHNDGATIVQPE